MFGVSWSDPISEQRQRCDTAYKRFLVQLIFSVYKFRYAVSRLNGYIMSITCEALCPSYAEATETTRLLTVLNF